MSYLKLPKTVSDHAIGFQSVNQAIDNNAALLDAFDSKHSIGVGGNSPSGFPTRAVGRHDDILIARSVADFAVNTTLPVPTLVVRIVGPIFGPLFYARLGTGQWRIFVATAQRVGAVALMKSTASADYKANCFVSYDPSTGPAITVSTWNINSASTPALADLPFSLILWAETA